jgi:alkylation response protein AidB-like acyl-CoA dehydrogenase
MAAVPMDERDVVADTLHRIFSDREGGDVSEALDEFGVAEFVSSDPKRAVPLVFSLQGEYRATSRTFQELVTSSLSGVLDGALVPATVVLPHGRSATQAAGRMSGNAVELSGVSIGEARGTLLVATETGEEEVELCLVDSKDAGIRTWAAAGLDPDLHLLRFEGRGEIVSRVPNAGPAWSKTVAWGRVALAYELVGLVRASLQLATEHARVRVQFGRQIGSFQAVKHRLADVLIAAEAAQAAADMAAEHADPLAAMVAKSMSGRAARIAARHCLQVLGGIGFTWEFPLHHFLKRGLVLDRLLGSSDDLPEDIGRILRVAGCAPRLVDL